MKVISSDFFSRNFLQFVTARVRNGTSEAIIVAHDSGNFKFWFDLFLLFVLIFKRDIANDQFYTASPLRTRSKLWTKFVRCAITNAIRRS